MYENHNQNLFCSGHAQTAFGNLIAAGGHISAGIGTNQSDLFTPQQNIWTALPLMLDDQEEPYTRWYPSVTTMADGRLIVTGGSYGLDLYRTKPHIYSPQSNTWEFLSGAENLEFDYYPFMFVLPKAVSLRDNNNVLRTFPPGSLVCVGWRQETRVLGYINNTWLWSNYINNSGITHSKDYSSAVMYEPGKIMKCGGGWDLQDGATDLTIHVDFTTSGPYSWKKETFANSQMAYGRGNFDLVILADGTVLAVGGNRGPLGNDVPDENTKNFNHPVVQCEIWNPATKKWRTVASLDPNAPRMYHSVSALLKDGTVIAAGGQYSQYGGYSNYQIYTPPYLMYGHATKRPQVMDVPPIVTTGGGFSLTILDGVEDIEKVALIRLASVTHGFDQNQRYVPLDFDTIPSQNKFLVTAPPTTNHAPPGYYMLFVLRRSEITLEDNSVDSQLVPSVAEYVRVRGAIELP